MTGHAVLDQQLCPADFYIELVSRAALQLAPQTQVECIPAGGKLSIVAPLGVDSEMCIILSMVQKAELSWTFSFSCRSRQNPIRTSKHATGDVSLSQNSYAWRSSSISTRQCRSWLTQRPKACREALSTSLSREWSIMPTTKEVSRGFHRRESSSQHKSLCRRALPLPAALWIQFLSTTSFKWRESRSTA